MTEYKSYRIVDGKSRWVIVGENGNITNRNPSKDELKGLDKDQHKDGRSRQRSNYVIGTICCRCIEEKDMTNESILKPGIARAEKDKDEKVTGRIICKRHHTRDYQRYDANKEIKILKTTVCNICGINFKEVKRNTYRERDKEGNETGKRLCANCWQKYDNNSQHNIIKSMRDCRTKNQDPNSTNAKGDKFLQLACILYGWEDLNKKYDNYRTPIDCYDPKTGLYHQIQGRYYSSIYRFWSFSGFADEWSKIFEDMICFCISEDGNIVERIYKFPLIEITRATGVKIIRDVIYNKCRWYEKYRIKDKKELKRANDIWTNMINKTK